MGVSPSNPQGMLNRLRGSVIVTSNSALNVTSDYLTPDGIVIEHTSDITDMMETMTGFVGAPHSKQDVIVTINLCRSQSLANEWFRQLGKIPTSGKSASSVTALCRMIVQSKIATSPNSLNRPLMVARSNGISNSKAMRLSIPTFGASHKQ